MKSILVFSHNHNTFDKRKLLENPNPQFLKESPKKVEDFIRGKEKEAHILKFFLNDVDSLLESYAPGKPEMKPEVLDRIKKMEEQRRIEQMNDNANNKIMINQNGVEKELNHQEIVNMMNGQIQEIRRLMEENAFLRSKIAVLEKKESES
jgi:hypothetical protein